MKTFFDFKNKSLLPVILSALAAVCALVAVIIYGATGVTNYTANKLDSGVIAFTVIGMAIALASIVFDLKLVKHAAFLCLLVSLLLYIVFEVDYIGSIFVGIDNTAVTGEFIMTTLMFALAAILSLVSAIATVDPFDKVKEIAV